MATHPRILAWEISWTEKPGGLQSVGLQRVGYDLATKQQRTTEQMLKWYLESERKDSPASVYAKKILGAKQLPCVWEHTYKYKKAFLNLSNLGYY